MPGFGIIGFPSAPIIGGACCCHGICHVFGGYMKFGGGIPYANGGGVLNCCICAGTFGFGIPAIPGIPCVGGPRERRENHNRLHMMLNAFISE